jgi:hypothetical protein
VYITVAGAPVRSKNDAEYFVAWTDRLIADAQNSGYWNTAEEKQKVVSLFESAKKKFQSLAGLE